MNTLVKAVRADALVGRGSCTSIDECFSDEELLEEVLEGCKTPEEAVRAARKCEGIYVEKMVDSRFGDDDDPQLAIAREYEERKAAVEAVEDPRCDECDGLWRNELERDLARAESYQADLLKACATPKERRDGSGRPLGRLCGTCWSNRS